MGLARDDLLLFECSFLSYDNIKRDDMGGLFRMTGVAFKSEYLTGTHVINGCVVIEDGKIRKNKFHKSVTENKAAKWLIENRNEVMNKLRRSMLQNGLGVHEVDECFDFAVMYFINGREFDQNYHGKEKADTYDISVYVKNQLRKYIVMYFRNDMKKRKWDKTVYLEDTLGDDEQPRKPQSISVDKASKMDFDKEREIYGSDEFGEVDEFDELNEIFELTLNEYSEEMKNMGLVGFNLQRYVYEMFLNDRGVKAMSEMDRETRKEIASALGITESSLEKFNKLIRKFYEERNDIFSELFEMINRLIQGKKRGWEPNRSWV